MSANYFDYNHFRTYENDFESDNDEIYVFCCNDEFIRKNYAIKGEKINREFFHSYKEEPSFLKFCI